VKTTVLAENLRHYAHIADFVINNDLNFFRQSAN